MIVLTNLTLYEYLMNALVQSIYAFARILMLSI